MKDWNYIAFQNIAVIVMIDFDFKNLDDFKANIAEVGKQYASTCEEHLNKIGKKIKKEIIKNTPDSGSKFQADANKTKKENRSMRRVFNKNKLKKGWKYEIKGYHGDDLKLEIWTSNKKFHLIDRGHRVISHGTDTGVFAQGKHFFQKSMQEAENDIIPDELEKLMDDIIDKSKK